MPPNVTKAASTLTRGRGPVLIFLRVGRLALWQLRWPVLIFDCDWSLLDHGAAKFKRLDLSNLNPIYEREQARCIPDEGEVECVYVQGGEQGMSQGTGGWCPPRPPSLAPCVGSPLLVGFFLRMR